MILSAVSHASPRFGAALVFEGLGAEGHPLLNRTVSRPIRLADSPGGNLWPVANRYLVEQYPPLNDFFQQLRPGSAKALPLIRVFLPEHGAFACLSGPQANAYVADLASRIINEHCRSIPEKRKLSAEISNFTRRLRADLMTLYTEGSTAFTARIDKKIAQTIRDELKQAATPKHRYDALQTILKRGFSAIRRYRREQRQPILVIGLRNDNTTDIFASPSAASTAIAFRQAITPKNT